MGFFQAGKTSSMDLDLDQTPAPPPPFLENVQNQHEKKSLKLFRFGSSLILIIMSILFRCVYICQEFQRGDIDWCRSELSDQGR